MTPSVNQAVLTHIVQALKEGQIRYCESLGFSPQELCELTRLTADDILFLSNSAVQFITTHIDHEMLGRMLARMEQERLFQQRLEQALSSVRPSIHQPLLWPFYTGSLRPAAADWPVCPARAQQCSRMSRWKRWYGMSGRRRA
ncbi:Protein of uncharacterised function (DUF2857) [Escherichia coli]|uniref:Protein of uncharacterized function (DUF2857) n=1 Tax=Escherichia coli TaxID=562 RepID=A0A376TNE1_ECOLX|nr:Protein of uncharacterised function (DUF2857) [Escherichia coli]